MPILVIHDRVPMTRNLPRRSLGTPHVPGNSVISSRNPSFGLPLDVTSVVSRRTGNGRAVSKLERHLAEQDSSGKHIRHLQQAEIRRVSVIRTRTIRDLRFAPVKTHRQSILAVLWSVQQPHPILTLHHSSY